MQLTQIFPIGFNSQYNVSIFEADDQLNLSGDNCLDYLIDKLRIKNVSLREFTEKYFVYIRRNKPERYTGKQQTRITIKPKII